MMNKTSHSTSKRGVIWGACLVAIAFMLAQPDRAQAQWINNGNHIHNTNAGNVGIGTTTPGSKLEVIGNIALSDSGRVTAKSDFGNYLMPYTSFGRMAFGTQGFDRLSILYNGNVGIGTTNPISALHVATESNAYPRGIVSAQHTADNIASSIALQKSRGSMALPAAVLNGDNISNFASEAYDGTSYVSGGRIRFAVDGAVTTGSIPTAMQFLTGTSAGGIEQMRITSTGNVGIGTMTPASKLEVVGNIALSRDSRITSSFDFGNYIMPYESFTGRMVFRTAGFDQLSLLYNGNVGIGTTNPTVKLEVAGEILATGAVASQSFRDRSSGRGWVWYGTGDVARFWNASFGDLLGITPSGSIGIGTTAPASKLHVVGDLTLTGSGNISLPGTITAGVIVARYQDIAEWVPARHTIPAGTVVVLDTENSNHVVASLRAYDTRVAGVISETPGVILGEAGEGKVKVATTGRVRVKVDATRGAIRVGDLLVTSDKQGVAMRSEPLDLGGTPIHRPGTLIGKALEPLDKGVGEILVLLSLQ